jgi:hypothetical protein
MLKDTQAREVFDRIVKIEVSNRWLMDMAEDNYDAMDLIRLWSALDQADSFTWSCSRTRLHSAKSTYHRLWQGAEMFAAANCIRNAGCLSSAKSSCG